MLWIGLQTATKPLLLFEHCFCVKFASSSETLTGMCYRDFFLSSLLLLLFSGRVAFDLHPSELVPRALTKALRFH